MSAGLVQWQCIHCICPGDGHSVSSMSLFCCCRHYIVARDTYCLAESRATYCDLLQFMASAYWHQVDPALGALDDEVSTRTLQFGKNILIEFD